MEEKRTDAERHSQQWLVPGKSAPCIVTKMSTYREPKDICYDVDPQIRNY